MKWGRRALDSLDDDIRDHIERETQDNIDRGMSPGEAHRHAMLQFGNVALAKEDTRAVWRWQALERLSQDSRYAFRVLKRSPGFSPTAILSVALGIAVNTTMFSVVNAVLLRTVPFADPERLVRLVQQHTGGDVTIPEYQVVKEHGRLFTAIAAYRGGGERRLEGRGVQTWVTALMDALLSTSRTIYDRRAQTRLDLLPHKRGGGVRVTPTGKRRRSCADDLHGSTRHLDLKG
ncbi:MAG TPA: permease prefix domain 1-containing protein [Vicinamibacterales bacterium]|nr:permease prefix domain 1-containing protein [Vicinamibacterales bacterium]